MKRILYSTVIFFGLIFFFTLLQAQDKQVKKNTPTGVEIMPINSQILYGKLQNGLTYYIRENKKPEKRAELQLVVNVGSVYEDDNQQGLAHFCEHMAFNGTKNFPKQALIDYLESIGMKFGPEVNAYTGFEQTVYMIQVPTDKIELLEKGIQIIEDWAHNVSYLPEEIEKERGVIIEEDRLGRGADERMRNIQIPVLLKNSKFAERLPIGKREIIEKFEHKDLIRFYKDWYRPDLMAVIAVGDFDKTKVLKLIKDHFSKLTGVKNPRPRDPFPIPDHKDRLFAIASDKEASASRITVYCKHEPLPFITTDDFRKTLIQRLANGMLSQRITELLQKPDAPFSYGGSGMGRWIYSKEFFTLSAGYIKNNQFNNSLELLLTEQERVKLNGFTAGEFERLKSDMLKSMERQYNERDKTESIGYADEYVRHFTQHEATPGIEYEYEFYKKTLPGIKLDEVNQAAKNMLTEENTVFTVNAPEKPDVKIPAEDDLKSVIEIVKKKSIAPYEDKVLNQPLLEKEPVPTAVTAEKNIMEIDVTEWTLGNGVKVVLKPTDFKNDQIVFTSFSPGGSSLVDDKEYVSTINIGGIIRQCGIGKFNSVDLKKYLTGKIASVSPYLGELTEGLSGSCSPKDIETMFQMIYLNFTDPKEDENGYLTYKSQIEAQLENMRNSPESAFSDTLTAVLGKNHFRRRPMNKELLKEMDFKTSFKVYKERFADASDFTFFFVGKFDLKAIKPLIEKYLGGLPSLKRNEDWKDIGFSPLTSKTEKEVFKGIEPKSMVAMVWVSPFEWTRASKYELESLREVLNIKLRENIREEKGGTYGVYIGSSPAHYPKPTCTFYIMWGCKPERVDELVKTAKSVIDSVKNFGPTEKYISKVQEIQRRSRETEIKQNNWWMGVLSSIYQNNENPLNILDFNKIVDGLNASIVQKAAQKYLQDNNIKVVLYPEKK